MNETVKLPATELTNVEISKDGVLYIYIAEALGGTERRKKLMMHVKEIFQKSLPDVTVIVGFDELRFSTITKKQEFVGRLDGQIKGET